ncbi:uncharacterized protein LOC132270006 [Cornus florida]|uniref:uncharacterized protein LOC132270006 n=1 Tax=Cornus florida TaxID=4283 RepID=UPI002898B177|nr:uncharacterized protein LOC132270006 [Cornus florida]
MLVKSLKAQDHLVDLQETFQVLRKHQMKLNPSKCAFRVSSGKFLGYMVSRRGIEANPEKVQAILNMQSPASTKELQRLIGRIAALNRAKEYLTSPPLLSRAMQGEQLYLYLAVSPSAVSSTLVHEEDGNQKPHAIDKQEEAESTWTLYVDGSVNARASGARLVIISPNGECIKYALRFGFKVTNNEVEYEALLAGLRMAKALEVERLVAYTDSQLITGQVQGEYEAKDEKMKTYLHKIEDIKGFFKKFSIHRTPREENAQADALARLATTEEDKAIPVGYLDEPSMVWDWPQKIHQVE